MNALGGEHPILYCTWRKNPEERTGSDGSAPADPSQTVKPRGVCGPVSRKGRSLGTVSMSV